MSLFRKTTLVCPACGGAVDFEAVHSVNVDRRPSLREDILAERFQQQACPSCSLAFRLEPEFQYVDAARGQWIAAYPLGRLGDWRTLQQQAGALFDRVYRTEASPYAREVGQRLRPRIVFGWAALREKLVCATLAIDDVELELCKADVMRNGGEDLPIEAETELRLVDGNAQSLVLAWLRAFDEETGDLLEVSRELLDDIAADTSGDWAALRAEVGEGLFVDLNRLMLAA